MILVKYMVKRLYLQIITIKEYIILKIDIV